MEFPIASRYFTSHINTDVLKSFRNADPTQKNRVLGDAMSIWELIKDMFNGFNHYTALSCLYDLAYFEQVQQKQQLDATAFARLLRAIDTRIARLNTLIDSRYVVQATIDSPRASFVRYGSAFPCVSVDITAVSSQCDNRKNGTVELFAHLFNFSFIEDESMHAAWTAMASRFTDTYLRDPLSAVATFFAYFGDEDRQLKADLVQRFFTENAEFGDRFAAFTNLIILSSREVQKFRCEESPADINDAGESQYTYQFYFDDQLLDTVMHVYPPSPRLSQNREGRGDVDDSMVGDSINEAAAWFDHGDAGQGYITASDSRVVELDDEGSRPAAANDTHVAIISTVDESTFRSPSPTKIRDRATLIWYRDLDWEQQNTTDEWPDIQGLTAGREDSPVVDR